MTTICAGAVFLFIVVIIIIIYQYQKKAEKRNIEQKKATALKFAQRHVQIIQESMELINKSKNLKTIIRRFDTILENVDRLIVLAKQYDYPDITKPVPSEMKEFYTKDRERFIREYVLEQVADEIERAKTITRKPSKIAILDKALLLLFDGKKALRDENQVGVILEKEKEIRDLIKHINSDKNLMEV